MRTFQGSDGRKCMGLSGGSESMLVWGRRVECLDSQSCGAEPGRAGWGMGSGRLTAQGGLAPRVGTTWWANGGEQETTVC